MQTTDSDAVNGKDMYAIQFLYAPEYTCVVCPKANIPSEIEDMAYSILASSEVYDTEENFLASATRAAQLAKKLIASKGRIDLNDGVVLSDDSEDTNIIACPLNEVFDAKFGAPPAYLNIHLPSNGMK